MSKGRSFEKALLALKVLWENRTTIGSSLYTYEASRVITNSGIFDAFGAAQVVRRLEKKGFFEVCGGGRGRGNRLKIKWTDTGINHFGGEKPKEVALYRNGEKVLAAGAVAEPKPERLGAIFVDWDNLIIPAKMDRNLDSAEINIHLMRALFEASLKFVDKAYFFIFTSEGHLKRNSFYLEVDAEDLEIELITVPTVKDAADEEIRKKAEELANSNPEIPTFIFASGDGYFFKTIVKLIQDFRKKVILMPYCKDNTHRLYKRVNGLTDKFIITFLKPYFCKNG